MAMHLANKFGGSVDVYAPSWQPVRLAIEIHPSSTATLPAPALSEFGVSRPLEPFRPALLRVFEDRVSLLLALALSFRRRQGRMKVFLLLVAAGLGKKLHSLISPFSTLIRDIQDCGTRLPAYLQNA
jgi:hypothetical protein